jgi:group II intron reverse transcriptase/maturase
MSVPRKDGDQKTTKLERIGKVAEIRRDTVFNNIAHVVDLDLLRNSYQQLDGKKAVGIDGITKAAYGINLEDNLQDLLRRIQGNAYKPQASRIVEIPKEDGSTRPLAIACFEDKLVQHAVNAILTKIYEPLFLPSSYGFREGMNPHQALRALMKYSYQNTNGAIVEIDLQKYFNSIPHSVLMDILHEKISDKRFLKLVEKLIRSPIMVEGKAVLNIIGCPQGSICSPILSNIYLHYVIDDWFSKISKTHIKGRADLVRFADDMVFVFQYQDDAIRFYEVLPKRLEKFGLKLHEGKSSNIPSGSMAAKAAHKVGKRIPTYKFLGFTCYWGLSRNKKFWRLKFKSRSDRFTAKLNGLRKYLKENSNQETQKIANKVKTVVQGWINYHAISDNQRKVSAFIRESERILFKWRNRKGNRRKLSWEKFARFLQAINFPASFKTTSMFATYQMQAKAG